MRRTVGKYASLFSQLYRFISYSVTKPKMHLEHSMMIISVDVDVGSSQLGVINKGTNDANIVRRMSEYQVGQIEEIAFSLFFEMFNEFETPVTFAIRGQLTEVSNSILELLAKSSVEHDIGAHGYYHKEFTTLSRNEAEKELKMISAGMKKLGITPRSFVFPRNSVAHLDLLEKYGYKCYRGHDEYAMCIEREGKLYNVHPSLYADEDTSPVLLKKLLDISITRNLPFHVWFHPWGFGETKKEIHKTINTIFVPFLRYAKEKENGNRLSFETMLSAVSKVENR